MGKEYDDVTISVHTTDGSWTPNHGTTWESDVAEPRSTNEGRSWVCKIHERWNSAWTSICNNSNPFLLRFFKAKKQWIALSLFLCGVAAPLIILGYWTPRPEHLPGSWPPFYNVFAAKYMSCGNYIDDNPANSTIKGLDGLFVLDATWGRYSFSTVKVIDVAWDIIVGRGVQLFAWWIAYNVFSDALLRVIERHPASFRIFQRIALEGPSVLSTWTLCKELFHVKSKRTKALFAYITISTTYVLCLPMFMGAMTGYDSTSIAWMDLDDSNNIVPTSAVKLSWALTGTSNSTFGRTICVDSDDWQIRDAYIYPRMSRCTCQMPNGTLASPGTFNSTRGVGLFNTANWKAEETTCLFNYPGSTETWTEQIWDPNHHDPKTGSSYTTVTYNCNETTMYTINDKQYDIQTLLGEVTYCYNGKTYSLMDLDGRSRCLPDTFNPSYQWGFSTMLSGIFIFVHFAWGISMYIVWLDAQSGSSLLREGYSMTPLRAAFAIAKAVKRKTGLGEKQLVRCSTRELDRELDGTRGDVGTKIDFGIFVAGDAEDGEGEGRVARTVDRERESTKPRWRPGILRPKNSVVR